MRNTVTHTRAGAVLLALTVTTLCVAQSTPPPPQRSRVTITQVKPDMLHEWMDLQKNEVIPALKKAGVTRRTVSRTVFGNTYEYTTIQPFDKYGEMDSGNPFAKALGPQGAARLSEKLRKCVSGSFTYVITRMPDLTNPRTSQEPPAIAVSQRVRVAPGKNQEWEDFQKNEILPIYKKLKIARSVSRRGFGGNSRDRSMTTYYSNFAELDAGNPFAKVLGPGGTAKLFAKGAGLSASVETVVRARVADLSF